MRVLVTGGAGWVGGAVVKELRERGHEVTVLSRSPGEPTEGVTTRAVDITDYAAVVEAVAGHDRVIHLAAIPSPRRGADAAIFDTNVRGTYHLYEACAEHGIKQLAVASSINALGNKFGRRRIRVEHFPIDEAQTPHVSDAYSLSKLQTEQLGQYAWDRHGISSVSLRIPWVIGPHERAMAFLHRVAERAPQGLSDDFWVVVDVRDSARAFADGIEVPYDGPHVLFVNDDWNPLGIPSRELAAAVYPEVTDWRAPIEADEALVSCRRAKELLGWSPRYSWRGVAAGAPAPLD